MKEFCFGVDIGGTSVKLGFFSSEGELLEKWEIPTRKEEKGAYILKDIAQSIENKTKEKQIAKEQIAGVGLGAPGPVTEDGMIHNCVNMGWGTFDLAKEAQFIIQLPVKVGNDANVAALGESWKGAGKGCDNLVMITLGTGIGGGIVINGKMTAGVNGAGGEIGHMFAVEEETQPCNCGRIGCLEQAASATGIVRVAKRFLQKDSKESSLRQIANLTAKDVLDCAKQGDNLALEILDYVCYCLGKLLANVACVVDPEMFVIGGGVSKAGDFLLEGIKKQYQKYALYACKSTKFVIATLGNDAGIYGCAKLILGK